jgi:phosphoglycerate kinase
MRSIKPITSIKNNLKGKTALVRVDFNVPIKNGKVVDDFRIRAAVPTIKFLLKKGAKIIIITHLGEDGRASLAPVVKHFFKISKLQPARISFLNNVRKFPGEMKNDQTFAKKIADMGDIYVNEAFSASHRAHASIVSIPRYLRSFAGIQFDAEIENLSLAFKKPKRPFLFIIGGAKFSTKVPLIKKYLKLADHVFVGGALANNFLKARGDEVGKSLVSDDSYGVQKLLKNKKLILPSDFVKKNGTILDIGEKSIENLATLIKKSHFILWNGPLGKYEAGGGKATKKVLKLVALSKAESVIGGGDTVALISEMKLSKKFSFISTGGGATLEFLSTGTLSGLKALR